MKREDWLRRQIRINNQKVADLRRRTERFEEELADPDPVDPFAGLIEELRAAHEAVETDRTPANIHYRAYLLTQAVEEGISKYRLAQLLNVSRPMIYSMIDPTYQQKLKAKRDLL